MPQYYSNRTSGLWGLIGLISFCALFFLGDAIGDIFGWGHSAEIKQSDTLETAVVVALILALALTAMEIRKVLARQKRLEDQLRVASGAFAQLVEEYFDQWGLTPSEKDVALLAIKGFPIADIARIRETKEGTIKAQSNAIYRKAGVNGRPQLLSLFIEDLMAEGLVNVPKADED